MGRPLIGRAHACRQSAARQLQAWQYRPGAHCVTWDLKEQTGRACKSRPQAQHSHMARLGGHVGRHAARVLCLGLVRHLRGHGFEACRGGMGRVWEPRLLQARLLQRSKRLSPRRTRPGFARCPHSCLLWRAAPQLQAKNGCRNEAASTGTGALPPLRAPPMRHPKPAHLPTTHKHTQQPATQTQRTQCTQHAYASPPLASGASKSA